MSNMIRRCLALKEASPRGRDAAVAGVRLSLLAVVDQAEHEYAIATIGTTITMKKTVRRARKLMRAPPPLRLPTIGP
jgi:hypothetical protein